MSTIQERLQIKRVPIDKWSVREQLCLASAVVRSGDQNWSSVSRALKPFAEPNRPPDWFSQKNCAAQYGSLLENVETPKRKKRMSGQMESGVETPSEYILRKLVQERKVELRKKIEEERQEYFKLKEEMNSIKQGIASDTVISSMLSEIEQEKKQKEQDAVSHTDWLKQREERKLELERVFRTKLPQQIGQKRKASETIESIIGVDVPSEETIVDTNKPAPSPLLTSLLKTPSSLPNVPSSILHSAITSQRVTSPTIASLLNSSATVPVSPSLQQLVTTAISQEPSTSTSTTPLKTQKETEDTTLPLDSIIKIEVEEEPSKEEEPKEEVLSEKEIKEEEEEACVEDVKQEVNKEEENDSKDDDKTEVEKSDEIEVKEEEETTPSEETAPEHDVYDFDESSNKTDNDESAKETATEASLDSEPELKEETSEDSQKEESEPSKTETKLLEKKKEIQPGSVEIVEVLVEDDDSDKEINKKVADIVGDKTKEKEIIQSTIEEQIFTSKEIKEEEQKESTEDEGETTEDQKTEKSDKNTDTDASSSEKAAMTPEYTEAFFDITLESTKSGKAKRDYSRIGKKKDKDDKDHLEMYHVIEKIVHGTSDENEETGSEHGSQDSDKKSDTSNKKLKDNLERSNSPWMEEEEASYIKTKRRYSTPATPIDSVPNSPASSIAYDDDRDYKAWKKSVMLVYSRLAAHKYASLFLKPITDEQAPGYHSMVYRPMDLQTVRRNVENGNIKTTAEFYRDVMLMFCNAIMYNKSNDHVYNMARKMQQEGMQEIQILFQAQAVETPSRRETRTSESGLKRKRAQEDIIRTKKRRDE